MDKDERFHQVDDTLKNVEAIYKALQQNPPNPVDVQRFANQARSSLDSWFALIPSSDLDKVSKLFVAGRKADTNRNGQLEDDELANMEAEYREVWKRRIELFGR